MSDTAIIKQGYRNYQGKRLGLAGSFRSVMFYSARFAFGLGRSWTSKVVPAIAFSIAVLPAVVIACATLVTTFASGSAQGRWLEYDLYYHVIVVALYFFCGVAIPDILVSDRRSGMLSLYMSTSLGRRSYLAAKACASVLVLTVFVILPVLTLLIGYTLTDQGPDGLLNWGLYLVRVVLSGMLLAVLFASVSMAVASFTDRLSYATVCVTLALLGSRVAGDVLAANYGKEQVYVHLLNINKVTLEIISRIYRATKPSEWLGVDITEIQKSNEIIEGLGLLTTPVLGLVYLAWIGTAAAIVLYRYKRLAKS